MDEDGLGHVGLRGRDLVGDGAHGVAVDQRANDGRLQAVEGVGHQGEGGDTVQGPGGQVVDDVGPCPRLGGQVGERDHVRRRRGDGHGRLS